MIARIDDRNQYGGVSMKVNKLCGIACIMILGLLMTSGCASMGAINIPVDRLKEKYGTEADRYLSLIHI